MIFEAAGAIGVDPWPYTLRELVWMNDGRARQLWGIAANQMALLANTVRDPRKRKEPFEARDFNPYASPARRDVIHDDETGFKVLKRLFVTRPQRRKK
jgi:hypothetical protein